MPGAKVSRMKLRVAALSGGVSLLLIAGCGGSEEAPIEPITEEPDTELNATPTKNQLINQADAICGETNAAIANLGVGGTLEDSALATQQAAITRGLAEALRDLGQPNEDSVTLDAYLDAVEKEARLHSQRATAAAEGDTVAFNEIGVQIDAAQAEAATAAEAYGFSECGGVGEPLSSGGTGGTTTPTTPAPTTPAPTTPTTPTDPGGSTGGTSGGSSGGGSGGSTGGTGGSSGGIGGP